MRWEALIWSLLAITAPAGLQMLWRRFHPNMPEWIEPLIPSVGWMHGLFLPYLALISGSIPGGLVGLYAIDPLHWFAGALACLLGLAAVFIARRFQIRPQLHLHSAVDRWKDEPRWALYRATGSLWINDFALGTGAGLLFAGLEWALTGLTRQPNNLKEQDREPLYRSAVSTALFLLTRNFWLTAGTQLAFFVLLETWAERQQGEGEHTLQAD
jgi:hypothetical protein